MNRDQAQYPPLDSRRLQVFMAVAEQLSFTKAARTLRMTQPAVTFQIRKLEDRLDIVLFDRAHNKALLTEVGTAFYKFTKKHFAESDKFLEDLQKYKGIQNKAYGIEDLEYTAKLTVLEDIRNNLTMKQLMKLVPKTAKYRFNGEKIKRKSANKTSA